MASENYPASATVESLGKVLYEQKPDMSNQIAGIIISVLMVAGGVALGWLPIREIRKVGGRLPLYHEHDMSWAIVALLAAICGGLIVGGILLFRWIWSMFTFRLYVCSEGFYYTQGGETNVFGFNEIQLVEETILHERLPIVKGAAKHLMPTKTSHSYRVVRCDGKTFDLTGNVISRVSLLSGPLTTAAGKYNFEWRTQETTK